MRFRVFNWVVFLTFVAHVALSDVTHYEIESREPVEGTSIRYELIRGRLHFATDPLAVRNTMIADMGLAPTDADDQVRFSADFRLLKPLNPDEGKDFAWVEIPNRGGVSNLRPFAMQQGFTVLEVGWEFDIPDDPKRLNIEVPTASNTDGSPIQGEVNAIFIVNAPQTEVTVTDLAAYPPVDAPQAQRRLVLRDSGDKPGGQTIPEDQWSLKENRVRLEGGFEPGRTYEIRWTAQNPPIAGLGFAAIRDAVSWLKYDTKAPIAVAHAAAFGASQCGRFLRDFLYFGFNTDTADRPVLDGVIPHIAGAGHLDLNRRWATPRELALFRAASYPFADQALLDPVSGLTEGILENPRSLHRPKVFYTNTSAEYWGAGRASALIHAAPDGSTDLILPEDVRVYLFAGAQHGTGPFPPPLPPQPGKVYLTNPVNFARSVEALRLALYQWIVEGTPPPDSDYPKFSDQTLVSASQIAFPPLPEVPSPRSLSAGTRYANPLHPGGAGAGHPLPLYVPEVGPDGNELAGIKLPEVAVPLATYTGWLFRPAAMGAPHELLPVLRGTWIPFAKNREAREHNQDPRLSLAERYASRQAYLDQYRLATEALVQRRLLLPEHVEAYQKEAEQRWDWLMENSP